MKTVSVTEFRSNIKRYLDIAQEEKLVIHRSKGSSFVIVPLEDEKDDLILNDAQNDIAKAMLFYENQKDKLGEYFLDSIMSDIESLYIYYGIHFKVKDYFRVLSKRFPFSIYYKFDKNFIYIYAVLGCRQNPILLNTRLEK